jgi:malonyl-CoA O-methyltransferase
MPAEPTRPQPARAFDGAALDATLRRLARAAGPPWLHAEVARRMRERLAIVKARPDVIVDWWGHTGAGAALLAQTYPHARRLVVEPTPALAAHSRDAARTPWWSTRRWAQRDDAVVLDTGLDAVPPGGAGLLWSNMMLHAVADPPALLARWQRALAADGFAMFSCLGPGSLRGLHALYREQGWGEPGAAFVDMHDLGDMLLAAGFADPVMDQEVVTLTWHSPQALLAELRGLGANASPTRGAGLRTPRWRDRLLDALQSLAGADGRLSLGFEIVYGHAFKAAPRAAPGGETAFSVEEMRKRLRAVRGRSG